MKILILDPGKPPETLEISGDLTSMQEIVGGYIQAIYPFDDTVALICNEEFTDLTTEQFAYYENYYKKPEFFLKTDNGIIVLKL